MLIVRRYQLPSTSPFDRLTHPGDLLYGEVFTLDIPYPGIITNIEELPKGSSETYSYLYLCALIDPNAAKRSRKFIFLLPEDRYTGDGELCFVATHYSYHLFEIVGEEKVGGTI